MLPASAIGNQIHGVDGASHYALIHLLALHQLVLLFLAVFGRRKMDGVRIKEWLPVATLLIIIMGATA